MGYSPSVRVPFLGAVPRSLFLGGCVRARSPTSRQCLVVMGHRHREAGQGASFLMLCIRRCVLFRAFVFFLPECACLDLSIHYCCRGAVAGSELLQACWPIGKAGRRLAAVASLGVFFITEVHEVRFPVVYGGLSPPAFCWSGR